MPDTSLFPDPLFNVITTCLNAKVNADNIVVLYVGGDDFDEVHAICQDGTELLIQKFLSGSLVSRQEKAGAFIHKLHRFCDELSVLADNFLYADLSAVGYVSVIKNFDARIPFSFVAYVTFEEFFLPVDFFNSRKEADEFAYSLNQKISAVKLVQANRQYQI